jgi:uncharacterized protein YjbI with pentapeptide repeats
MQIHRDSRENRGKGAMLKKAVMLLWAGMIFALCLRASTGYGFDQSQLQLLLTTKQCPGCDLSNASLSGTNLFEANLAGANLTGAFLSDSDLAGANLSKANLTGAFLNYAYLANANLTDANLTGAKMFFTILISANLSGANLTGAKLSTTIWVDGSRCAEASVGQCIK